MQQTFKPFCNDFWAQDDMQEGRNSDAEAEAAIELEHKTTFDYLMEQILHTRDRERTEWTDYPIKQRNDRVHETPKKKMPCLNSFIDPPIKQKHELRSQGLVLDENHAPIGNHLQSQSISQSNSFFLLIMLLHGAHFKGMRAEEE